MPSTVWCKSIAIDPKENYVVIGFETSVVRFFKTTSAEQFREDRLHGSLHSSCASCPPVDTLSFSRDGIALLASTRHQKNGLIQLYCWRFPFESFQELRKCWYQVPLHESEDNGISSAVLRTSDQGVDPLLCITTWTQSGVPLLIQPRDGHRSEIRTESGRQSKVGSRVQCAAFSASGRELALVNEKGNLFQITNLESSPLEIRRIATSKELTAKSESFAMNFVTIDGEESIIMAWVDANKSLAWVKKIPIANKVRGTRHRRIVNVADHSIHRAQPQLPRHLESYEGGPKQASAPIYPRRHWNCQLILQLSLRLRSLKKGEMMCARSHVWKG